MTERVLTVLGNKATRPITDFALQARGVGDVYYVDSNNGDDGRAGQSPETSVATLDYAIGLCTANQGDIIYVLPGHAETVSAASGVDADVEGISIIGLGEGGDRPTFTFSAVDATMTVAAASIVVKNLLIKPSIDSVASPIVVSAANCAIDVEVQDASAAIECVTAILTTADADNLDIKLKYRGFIAGNACVSPIKLVGVDTARVYVDFYGVASTSVVEFHTTACHDIDITGLFYNDGTSLTKNVVDTEGNGTWSVRGWDGNSNSNFSGGDNAALAADDARAIASAVSTVDTVVDGIQTDLSNATDGLGALKTLIDTAQADLDILTGATGANLLTATQASIDAIETDTETTIPNLIATAQADLDILTGATGANLLTATQASIDAIETDTGTTLPATMAAMPQCVVKTDGAVLSGDDPLFTITGGPVRAKIVGIVTTLIGGAANLRLQMDVTTPAGTVELNAGAVAVDAGAAGTLYYNVGATSVFTPVTAGAVILDPVTVEEAEFILPPGTVMCLGSAAQDGVIAWYMSYIPLSPSSVVTAAA